jgi:integrase
MVREKKRPDNPCRSVALPKSDSTEELATFLTHDEWTRVVTELTEPYKSFFSFLIQTGLRFSEATALEAVRFLWRWKRVLRTVSGGPLQEPVVTR